MKKIISIILCAFLAILVIPEKINAEQSATESGCIPAKCMENKPDTIEKSITKNGTTLIIYEDGVEVEMINGNEFIIKDYKHSINNSIPDISTYSWITIGIAILKIAYGVVSACGVIQYVADHDICRTVLGYIVTPSGSGEYRYTLSGNYIAGYIPGCEPAHSLPCNQGYWQYSVSRS